MRTKIFIFYIHILPIDKDSGKLFSAIFSSIFSHRKRNANFHRNLRNDVAHIMEI